MFREMGCSEDMNEGKAFQEAKKLLDTLYYTEQGGCN